MPKAFNRPVFEGPPKLRPEESTQRAARIAVDMAVMNTQYMLTLEQFMGPGEMFHLQMHLLFTIVDTIAIHHEVPQETVLGLASSYLERLRWERNEYKRNDEKDKQPTGR